MRGHYSSTIIYPSTADFLGIAAKGAEYHLFRQSAKQHWDSMRSYYQKVSFAIVLLL